MCIPYLVWCVIFHWSINRACIVLISLLAYFLICVLKHYRWWHCKTRQCPCSSPLCEHRLGYIMCSTALYSHYGKSIVFSYCCFFFFPEIVSELFIIFLTSNSILFKSWGFLLPYLPGKCLQIIELAFGKDKGKGKYF